MNLLNTFGYVSKEVFSLLKHKIAISHPQPDPYLSLIADMIRYNTLLSVSRSGTGHLGASLSIIETLTEIYFRSFNFSPKNLTDISRDIFILSKGHAAPALYATLSAKGYFSIERLNSLRRLKGLAGHCDIETPGIEANTGSLAMGLSKAVGFAITKKRFRLRGDVIVIIGDGEMQEGQCWEAFLSASSYKLDNLYIIIDDNKVQTDQLSKNIVQYGDLKSALENFGFSVHDNKGQSCNDIYKSLNKLKQIQKRPKLLWNYTIKGQGVSFMEHHRVLSDRDTKYIWHNKAPNKDQLAIALNEIADRNKISLDNLGITWDIQKSLSDIPIVPMQTNIQGNNLISGFSSALVKLAPKYKYFVTLDGDLEEDSGYIEFHKKYPERFFEMGIMEQHMVSAASAMSKLGYTPIITTYAAFLTSRANEQIYNLATEGNKALIVGNMAGVIPATPGKSHQAFRDIACMKNIPSVLMYQPISPSEISHILNRFFQGALGKILYLRLSLAPSAIELPSPPKSLALGNSHVLIKGKDALIIGIGPVVLGECLRSRDILLKNGINIEIWNYPWLIDFNAKQLKQIAARKIPLIIVEDHYYKGGFGESLMSFCTKENINFPSIKHIAMNDFPTTGFREEVLDHFGLSAEKIKKSLETAVLSR